MRRRELVCRGCFPAAGGRHGQSRTAGSIPVGAVMVHVCIGSVYAWSTFNRPIQALLADEPWWFSPPYTTFTTALALLGSERRVRRPVGRAARAAGGGDRRGALLRHRAPHRRRRAGAAPVAARFSRDGHRQRHRLRARLHLPGQHAREVVPGPPGHGHRHGDHGLRRRRLHRRLPERVPDGPRRRGDDGDGAGRRLSGGDARRLAADAVAAARLASRGLDSAGQDLRDDRRHAA